MQAQFISAAVTAVLSVAGAPGHSSAAEILRCDVESFTGSRLIPGQIAFHLQLDQNLATVKSGGIEGAYELAVPADVKQRSADSYVLHWVIQQPDALGNPAPTDVQYRAVLNTRNKKISLSATEYGGSHVKRRGAGRCTYAGE